MSGKAEKIATLNQLETHKEYGDTLMGVSNLRDSNVDFELGTHKPLRNGVTHVLTDVLRVGTRMQGVVSFNEIGFIDIFPYGGWHRQYESISDAGIQRLTVHPSLASAIIKVARVNPEMAFLEAAMQIGTPKAQKWVGDIIDSNFQKALSTAGKRR